MSVPKTKVIVNADDFGESDKANKAILRCFRENVISNTTILPNMPGFDEAAELSHEQGVSERVGIHLNIMEGRPITSKIRFMRKFCNSYGYFSYRRLHNFYFTEEEKEALRDEIASQIERCRAAGLSISHADSHQHVHTELPVFQVMAPVLRFYHIKNIRIAANISNSEFKKKVYKGVFNQMVRHYGFFRTNFFGGVADFKKFQAGEKLNGHLTEIMVHPYLDDGGNVIDILDGKPLIDHLKDILENAELFTYPLH